MGRVLQWCPKTRFHKKRLNSRSKIVTIGYPILSFFSNFFNNKNKKRIKSNQSNRNMSDSGTIDMDMELGSQTDSHRILQRYRPLEWIRKSGWWFPPIEHPLTTMEEKCQSVFQLGTCTSVCEPAHVHVQVKGTRVPHERGSNMLFHWIGNKNNSIPYPQLLQHIATAISSNST